MFKRLKTLFLQPDLWMSRLVFLAGPFLCLLMVETLNENDIFSALSPLQVLLNLVWYFCLFILVRIITGGNRLAGMISAVLCFSVGLLNHYVLRIRGRVLWPGDLSTWRTALNVAGSQDYSLDAFIVLGSMVLVGYLILVAACPSRPKGCSRLRKRTIAAGLAAILAYTAIFFCTGAMPALEMYPHQWNTRLNGFVLNFALAAKNMTFSAPDGYDRNRIMELAKQYPETTGNTVEQPENIVIIMNESFADFTIYDNFSASEDPTPFLHSLTGEDNTITGNLHSPSWRGGTATVEHEFLTGFNSAFQPSYTVAYQLYVHEDTPSLAQAASTAGYETIAFHPYLSSGWNRVQVYDYMGFDQQLYQEDVKEPEYIRDYISDASDYKTVIELTENNDGKLFIFNVTMQNHNGYAQAWTNLEQSIRLSDDLNGLDPEAEQYFACLRESDRALEELVNYYRGCDEPTLIVFFGDHQPPLSIEFYDYLVSGDTSVMNQAIQEPLYEVPFFIWANYDLDAKTGMEASPAALGAMTAELAGLPMTGLQQFVKGFQELFTGFLPCGLLRADGTVAAFEGEMTEVEFQAFQDYEALTYCGLLDQFKGTEPLFHVFNQK